MIPKAYIDAWRSIAPWTESSQIEQDLVISRAIVEIFSNDFLKENLAFRGGTAIHKLYLHPQARYSEDIKDGPCKTDAGSYSGSVTIPGRKR
jgi:hypothetical protein